MVVKNIINNKGGTLVDCRARDIDENGKTICTSVPYGNTHGSICEINGQWWCFYHRQTGLDQFSRQAMVAPVNVSVEKGSGGKVTISEAEFNSEGFCTDGLNPLNKSAAGWACWFRYPKGSSEKFPNFWFSGSYIKPEGVNGTVSVYVGGPDTAHGGKLIAAASVFASDLQTVREVSVPTQGLAGLSGKLPLFFAFASSEEDRSICELYDFQFFTDGPEK